MIETIEHRTSNEDLLDLVPETAETDLRSPRQRELMTSLVSQLRNLDADLADQAEQYEARMAGKWTPGRDGNASAWIDRMIAKISELRKTRESQTPAVPDGRYAVEYGDEIRCYHLETGKAGTRWDGFRFLNRRSSDDLFPIKNRVAKAEILDLIAQDVQQAEIRYALTVRECRRCHRSLTDTKNPYYSIGLGPDCGAM